MLKNRLGLKLHRILSAERPSDRWCTRPGFELGSTAQKIPRSLAHGQAVRQRKFFLCSKDRKGPASRIF